MSVTKCWGIGLGRTGTMSLCEAFRLLGFGNVIHNPPFEALAAADAGADNGVVIFYKYLDCKFPGSKFVLTTRELESWLASTEIANQTYPLALTNNDIPMMRRMLIYETVTFDRDQYIAARERHHRDVRRYFRDRPEDLLELDIICGEGWEKLCPFLDIPVPAMPFPHIHRRTGEPGVTMADYFHNRALTG
jgi:hypothetical protein